MRVTRPNPLQWFDATSGPDPLPLARPDCRTGALMTYPGEETRFYVNLAILVNPLINTPEVSLVQYRANGATIGANAVVERDVIDPTHATLYGSVICPSVARGIYRWQIVWGGFTWVSSLVEVLPQDEVKASSIRLEYRNSKTLHGIRYPWLDPLFSCALRVRAYYTPASPVVETSSYREATTGITRNYNTAADRVLKFQTAYADDDLLYGIEIILLHDTITLNGQSVTTREHLSFTAGRGKLMPGQFAFIDNSFATSLMLS